MKRTVILVAVVILVTLGLLLFRSRDSAAPMQAESLVSEDLWPSSEEAPLRTARWEHLTPNRVESAANGPDSTNLWTRFVQGDTPRVKREQLEPFLAKYQRNAEALIGALRASGDDALLKEAKERFPRDPRVQLAVAFNTLVPEERQQWLEQLKQSDPDNALANYLLAGQHLKAGRVAEALEEISAASVRPSIDNYLIDFMQSTEEAYRAGGFTDVEAKVAAGTSARLSEQTWLKQVGVELAELAKGYQQAGDEASAAAVLQMGLDLGQRLHRTPQVSLVQEWAGMSIERLALNVMNPDAPYGDSGLTVQDQKDALDARRRFGKDLIANSEPILSTMSDQDLAHFIDRMKLYGEVAALRWVINQAPRKTE